MTNKYADIKLQIHYTIFLKSEGRLYETFWLDIIQAQYREETTNLQ